MDGAAAADNVRLPALLIRGLCLLGLWVVLIGPAPAHLPVGLVASAAGVWASTALWPAGGRLSVAGLNARPIARTFRKSFIDMGAC